jgi:hypothetical protein
MTEQEVCDGIEIIDGRKSCEIRHKVYSGSITVYRPEREYFHSGDGVKINPGYINASSWGMSGSHDESAENIRFYMLARFRMWEIAVNCLNDYNEVLADWQPLSNPFREARDYKTQYESARNELRQIAEAKEAKKKKAVS